MNWRSCTTPNLAFRYAADAVAAGTATERGISGKIRHQRLCISMAFEKYLPLSAAMTEAAAILETLAMYPSSCLLPGGWLKERCQRLLIHRHYLSRPVRVMRECIGDQADWTLGKLHSPAEEEKGYSVCQRSRRSALTLRPSHKWSAYASLHVQAEAQQRTEAKDWGPPCLPRLYDSHMLLPSTP